MDLNLVWALSAFLGLAAALWLLTADFGGEE